MKVGQQIKSEIIHIRPEYIVTMLRGHANGKLAFIPTLQVSTDSLGSRVLQGQLRYSVKIHIQNIVALPGIWAMTFNC